MHSTTIFVPMTIGQAERAFLHRAEAFKTCFGIDEKGIVGFQNRDDAVKHGNQQFTNTPFAVLRITFTSHVHEMLAHGGQLQGAPEEGGRPAIWMVSKNACEALGAKAELTMEIIPVPVAPASGPAPTSTGTQKTASAEPVGPTGFGC